MSDEEQSVTMRALEELERLLRTAPRRPWRVVQWDTYRTVIEPAASRYTYPRTEYVVQGSEPDLALIVAAVNAAPALLRVARAAQLWSQCEQSSEPGRALARMALNDLRAALAALDKES